MHHWKLFKDLPREVLCNVEDDGARLDLFQSHTGTALDLAALALVACNVETVVQETRRAAWTLLVRQLLGLEERLAAVPKLLLADLLANHELAVEQHEGRVLAQDAHAEVVGAAAGLGVPVVQLALAGARDTRRRARRARRAACRCAHGARDARWAGARRRTGNGAGCGRSRRCSRGTTVRSDKRDEHVLHRLPVGFLARGCKGEQEAAGRNVVLELEHERGTRRASLAC